MFAGALLLAGAAGCTSRRAQTAIRAGDTTQQTCAPNRSNVNTAAGWDTRRYGQTATHERAAGPIPGKASPGKASISDTRLVTSASTGGESQEEYEPQPALTLPIARPLAAAPAPSTLTRASQNASLPRPIGQSVRGSEPLLSQPIRLIDPPLLQTPQVEGKDAASDAADYRLVIPRLRICRQVRGFEDVVALDVRRLQRGQPILIYATLENFCSLPAARGYRTLTLSTVEICTPEGDVVERQNLGTAVDLADTPRLDFFLTHVVTIPESLPAGGYILMLNVEDLLGQDTAQAQIEIRVTEGRIPRNGTADTSKSAMRPASFRR